MRRWLVVSGLVLCLGVEAEAARMLRARHLPTGQWFQRVDTGPKSEREFAEEVAGQFSVLVGEVEVVVTEATELARLTAVQELADGLHEGRTVRASPPGPTSKRPQAVRRGFLGIFPGTPADQAGKFIGRVERYPPLATFLALMRGTEEEFDQTHERMARAILQEIAARIGTPQEVLSIGEYQALIQLVRQSGLAVIIP